MDVVKVAFDFIERCSAMQSVGALLDDLLATVEPFGFQHLLLTGLPIPGQKIEPLVQLNGWPGGWYDRYVGRDYFEQDGVGLYAMTTTTPFAWSEVPLDWSGTSAAKQVIGEAAEFGLVDGFVVPMYGLRPLQAVLSLATSCRVDLDVRSRPALHLIAVYANDRVRTLLGEAVPNRRLSPREREVLSWTAAGKTAWETSMILSVSEGTILKHLERARRKLDAATTVQAVARAIRDREITP